MLRRKGRQAATSVSDLCRKHGITDAIFYMCHSNYRGLEVSDARELEWAGEGERQAEDAARGV